MIKEYIDRREIGKIVNKVKKLYNIRFNKDGENNENKKNI